MMTCSQAILVFCLTSLSGWLLHDFVKLKSQCCGILAFMLRQEQKDVREEKKKQNTDLTETIIHQSDKCKEIPVCGRSV